MTWGKARKKPIVIEFREPIPNTQSKEPLLVPVEQIETREGVLSAWPTIDFVIKGVQGEIYPIGKDIFYETYDVVEEIPSSEGSP